MTISKGAWVAYRSLLATKTKFGKFNTIVDKSYSLVDIDGVSTKCENKCITLIYEKNLLKQLNERHT